MSPPLEALPKAREAAARALARNDMDAEALAAVACTKSMFERDWTAAETLFSKAIVRNPGRLPQTYVSPRSRSCR